MLGVGLNPPNDVAVGRTILFSKWQGQEVEVGGKKVVFVKNGDVLAVLE